MPHARDLITWLPSEDEGNESDSDPAEAAGDPPVIAFERGGRFRVGDVEFRCSAQRGSRADRFFIRKDRALVDEYLDVLDAFPRANVVELGIAQGGSAALMALVATPRKLLAVELAEERVEALDELIARLGLAGQVKAHYGVDQADRERLRAIVGEEFKGEPLDLVIDDASHRLVETRASFETLFPLLRPGGLYLIEDWHQQAFARALEAAIADPGSKARADLERRMTDAAEEWSSDGEAGRRRPPSGQEIATRLALELVLAQAESEEFISELAIRPSLLRVRRGAGHLDPVAFRVSDLFLDYLGLLSPPQDA